MHTHIHANTENLCPLYPPLHVTQEGTPSFLVPYAHLTVENTGARDVQGAVMVPTEGKPRPPKLADSQHSVPVMIPLSFSQVWEVTQPLARKALILTLIEHKPQQQER